VHCELNDVDNIYALVPVRVYTSGWIAEVSCNNTLLVKSYILVTQPRPRYERIVSSVVNNDTNPRCFIFCVVAPGSPSILNDVIDVATLAVVTTSRWLDVPSCVV